MITPNRNEHVIIQPDDKINAMIHQMITPNENEYVIIQQDDNVNFTVLSSRMITSMMSSSQMIHLILSRPDDNSDQKAECYHQPDDKIYVIIQQDVSI
jgi:hypothetical protein